MKRTLILFPMVLFFVTLSYAQDDLKSSSFKLEYVSTDIIENQYDTLVDVRILIHCTAIDEIVNVYVVGGSEIGSADKYFKKFSLSDQSPKQSDSIQIDEENLQVKILLGRYNLASDMIHFNVFLENDAGDKSPYLKLDY